MNKIYKKPSLFLALFLAATPSIAQEQEKALAIEEVVITAQKRSESLQEVPIAVDAFTSASIERSGVSSLTDLSQISASFNVDEGTGGSQPYIRGIGSAAGGSGVGGAVAVYIDGAYVPRTYSLTGVTGDLDSAESVQVLKGPQGALYGRNATGGALVITTYTPEIGEEFNGQVKATIGDYGVREYSALISSGFGNNFAGSLSYSKKDADGFTEALGANFDDLDDADDYRVAGKLLFEPSDKAEFILSASFGDTHRNQNNFNQVGQGRNIEAEAIFPGAGLNNPQALYAAATIGTLGAVGFDLTNPAVVGTVLGGAAGLQFSDKYGTQFNNEVGGHENGILCCNNEVDGRHNGGYVQDLFVNLTTTIHFDRFDLVSITAHNDHELGIASEVLLADPASAPDFTTSLAPFLPDPALAPLLAAFSVPNIGFSGQFFSDYLSEELYLVSTEGNIDWLAGIYYFKEDGRTTFTNDAFGMSVSGSNNDWESEAIAFFAQASIPFDDHWSVTLGARYSEEENSIDDFVVGGVGNVDRTDNQTTYNAKITYQAEDWLVYAGYSTGFKSGSLNPQAPSAIGADPEEIAAFEIGVKSQFLDDRIQLNAAAFYYEYENIQLFVLNAAASTDLYDGAEPEVLGLELDLQAVISENLRVFSSATFLDHEYTTDAMLPGGGPGTTLPTKGKNLSQTADAVVIVGAEYSQPFNNGSELLVNLSANYNSGYWIDNQNIIGSGGLEDDAYTVANANVKYLSADDKWAITLYVNNLTDEEYFNGGAAANNLALVVNSARPRHYGLAAEYNF